MVSEIRIYAEGGGNKADTKALFREGLSVFLGQLRMLARSKSIRWNIIACGGRDQAYQRFVNAFHQHPGAFNVLLVDAEAAVAAPNAPWQHLSSRDGWNAAESSDENCHLMVQMMEAWFIADPAIHSVNNSCASEEWHRLPACENTGKMPVPRITCAKTYDAVYSLAKYYGQGFKPNQIPGAANVETVPKAQLLQILENATRQTPKGVYGKISHGCQLLQRIAPAVVRGKAPHCDLLFKTLMEKMLP